MTSMRDVLRRLVMAKGVSGYEWSGGIADAIQDVIGEKGQRIGNNLVYVMGSGSRTICVTAHMDEIGCIVTQCDGLCARILPIGSVSPAAMLGARLVFDADIMSAPVESAQSFADLTISTVVPLRVGMTGTFVKEMNIVGDVISAPSLDNRVGCAALVNLCVDLLNDPPMDRRVAMCFASREETGCNGVMSAVRMLQPDVCIDIDSAYGQPFERSGCENWRIPEIGGGVAIQLLGDGFVLCDSDRVLVERLCQEHALPFQYEIPDAASGATNAKTLLSAGYETIQLNIPVAFQHTASSRASLRDLLATTELVELVARGI